MLNAHVLEDSFILQRLKRGIFKELGGIMQTLFP